MEAEVSSAEDLEDDFKVVEGETEIVINKVATPLTEVAEELVRITDDKEDIPVNDEDAASSCVSNGSQSSGYGGKANIVVNSSSRRASGGQGQSCEKIYGSLRQCHQQSRNRMNAMVQRGNESRTRD